MEATQGFGRTTRAIPAGHLDLGKASKGSDIEKPDDDFEEKSGANDETKADQVV